jgi:hypothetical protein
MLDKSDFYLVRFACSFRPEYDEIEIEHARFNVSLRQTPNGFPVAYDINPMQVEKEIKHNVKFAFNPTLKFTQFEGSLGEVGYGLEYSELTPIISANGVGESNPSWDYSKAKGFELSGSKIMHMMMKVAKNAHPVLANALIIAKLRIHGSLIGSIMGQDETESYNHLSMVLVE